LLFACASTNAAQHNGTVGDPVLHTYSVLNIGKPGAPNLNLTQQSWLRLIKATSAYRRHWRSLRFADWSPRSAADKFIVPLVVFDPTPLRESGVEPLGYHVIGAPCNLFYMISDNIVQTFPHDEAVCSPLPAAVSGGDAFIAKWVKGAK
jgi:hypothetical protein